MMDHVLQEEEGRVGVEGESGGMKKLEDSVLTQGSCWAWLDGKSK